MADKTHTFNYNSVMHNTLQRICGILILQALPTNQYIPVQPSLCDND